MYKAEALDTWIYTFLPKPTHILLGVWHRRNLPEQSALPMYTAEAGLSTNG